MTDLKEVFEFPEGGDVPIHSQGSRYKRQALQRISDWYGAYIAHLTSLTDNSSVSSADRDRLKGYLLKW